MTLQGRQAAKPATFATKIAPKTIFPAFFLSLNSDLHSITTFVRALAYNYS
jgi:hypothetical protein